MNSSPAIRRAVPADAEALTRLINLAFQVERFFVDADRLALPEVQDRLQKGEFLVVDDAESLAGCVYLERRGGRAYLGLLSVDPHRQRTGLGRTLVAAAEDRARALGCAHMDLQIVNLRAELPAFYAGLGYSETGTSPFPAEVETRLPCHFVVMSKKLSAG